MQPFDLHKAALDLAESLIPAHVVQEEGEPCFNAATYLDNLATQLFGLLDTTPAGLCGSRIDTGELASYLWCCIALASGASPDCHTFRGMPVLD